MVLGGYYVRVEDSRTFAVQSDDMEEAEKRVRETHGLLHDRVEVRGRIPHGAAVALRFKPGEVKPYQRGQ